jgi:uncharacterized protein
MKLKVQNIPEEGITLTYRKGADEFESLRQLMLDSQVQFSAPLDIVLDVRVEPDVIRVQGSVTAVMRLNCCRCLAPFEISIQQRFTLGYSQKIPTDLHRPGTGGAGPGGIELTAEDIGLIYYQEDTIDFRDAVQEQVVLALPYKPLCSETCKGLCPGCGVDLNHENCRCRSAPEAGPFSVLKSLKLMK